MRFAATLGWLMVSSAAVAVLCAEEKDGKIIASFHCCIKEVQSGPLQSEHDFEVWIKGNKARTELPSMDGKLIPIKDRNFDFGAWMVSLRWRWPGGLETA